MYTFKKINNMLNKKITFLLAHLALFVVFFWFGAIKLTGLSPANELVHQLLAQIPIMKMWPFESFIIALGFVEMCIAILFLFKKTTTLAIIILIPHMFTTMLPLALLPNLTWQSFLIPTLAGQYIIKNIVIVALALSVVLENKKSK
jgi:uncharacterized membrane protein YkgB